MHIINDILTRVDALLGGSQWFAFLLLGTGLFYTLYLKFPQIRFFRHSIRVVRGKYDQTHSIGDASHFQALTTALSSTIGTGNIAGVALAIHLGGPSALFWMLVTAFLGMTTKMVEVTLSHKYREQLADGAISGGPMYYMKNRLNMKWLAAIFAVATIISAFGTGNLPQINSISNAIHASFGIRHFWTGAILTVVLALIIIGGLKRIVQVTEKLVPFMAIVYTLGAISVLCCNYDQVLPSLASIFTDVFTGTAATGGFMGATLAWAFNRGVNRGLFSNEAGQGSAPIAHAAAKADDSVAEGMVALLEPFIDTIVICMLTGLVLLSSGAWKDKCENQFQYADIQLLDRQYDEQTPADREAVSQHVTGRHTLPLFSGELRIVDGAMQNAVTMLHARSIAEHVKFLKSKEPYTGTLPASNGKLAQIENITITGRSLLHSAPLSNEAFQRGWLGKWGQYIIPLSLLLFAFSTTIAWSYYGDRAVIYLFGSRYVQAFRVVYVAGFFVASFTDTTIVWTLSGIAIVLMTIPNLLGILMLHKETRSLVMRYWNKIKGS